MKQNIDPFDPAIRRSYIGGTDASAVGGLSKWRSPYDVYLEKTGQPGKSFDEENEMFVWGHLLEPVIANEWIRRNAHTGVKIISENRFVDDPDYEFIKVNLDREAQYPDGTIVALECKTVASSAYKEWKLGVPLDYYTQVQWGLGVTGYDKCIFVILVMDSREMVTFEVIRDDDYITELRESVIKFWENHVAKRIPCDLNAEDFSRIRSLPKSVVADKDVLAAYEEIKALKAKVKTLTATLEEKQNTVKEFLGENEILITQGSKPETLFTWKGGDTEKLDTKKLKEELPDIYEKYKTTGYVRRFLSK